MNNFPDIDQFPEYKQLRKIQNPINDENFMPVTLDNIFNNIETEYILKTIKEFPSEKIRVQKWGGQGVLDGIKILDSMIKQVEFLASKACNKDLILAEYSIVKYSPEYGYEVKLFPHYDTRPYEMFVFDIQLESNIDWGIIVEGKQFNLLNNQALVFSGTQQMHWRENKKLPDGSEVLMMFCWLKHKNPKPISKEQSECMLERQKVLQRETNILSDETPRSGV